MSARPRIRTLKPEVWQDERLAGLGDFEHRLYVGLSTQADDEGRQSANPNLIRARIFPFDSRPLEHFADGLDALDRAGLIQLYETGGRALLQITSWAEDQRVDKPTASTLPAPPEIPRDSSRASQEGSRAFSPSRAPADRTGPGPGSLSFNHADRAEERDSEVTSPDLTPMRKMP